MTVAIRKKYRNLEREREGEGEKKLEGRIEKYWGKETKRVRQKERNGEIKE